MMRLSTKASTAIEIVATMTIAYSGIARTSLDQLRLIAIPDFGCVRTFSMFLSRGPPAESLLITLSSIAAPQSMPADNTRAASPAATGGFAPATVLQHRRRRDDYGAGNRRVCARTSKHTVRTS